MSIPPKVHILNRFSGAEDDTLLFLPNLTLWYGWHHRHGTLPVDWQDLTLSQICAELGVPVWESVRPYEIEWGAVRVERHESEQHREIRYCLGTDTLVERWQLGPDGDWWQVEYPVKSHADLAVLLKMVRERSYRWLPERLEPVLEAVGEAGTVAALLPRRPFAQLLLEWLGWSEGLMLLFDAEMAAQQILRLLEEQVASVEERAAQLPVEIIVSPDNLDAQFISPGFFARYLSDSYRRAAARFHKAGKYLIGYRRRCLAPVGTSGSRRCRRRARGMWPAPKRCSPGAGQGSARTRLHAMGRHSTGRAAAAVPARSFRGECPGSNGGCPPGQSRHPGHCRSGARPGRSGPPATGDRMVCSLRRPEQAQERRAVGRGHEPARARGAERTPVSITQIIHPAIWAVSMMGMAQPQNR